MTSLIADAGGPLATVARAAAFAGIAGTIGACALSLLAARGATNANAAARRALTDAVARFGAGAAMLTCAAVAIRVTVQALSFASPDEPLWPMVVTVLGTGWGRAAALQFGGGAAALVGIAATRTFARWGWATALAGCAVLAVTPAFMGHAGAAEAWHGTAVVSDVLHVLAGGAWAGALGALAWVLRTRGGHADASPAVADLVERFGPLAIAGASTLLVTGVVSTAVQLRTVSDLVATRYGGLLVLKVAVVLAAAALGRRHSRTAVRDIRGGKRAAVVRSISGEALLMLVVFAVTALLAGSPLPGE